MNNKKYNGQMATIDGNEAAAYVAHRTNEVCAIYPITPSSPMGELADEWSARGQKNIWGTKPLVIELQSEGGASGAVHGSLQRGALTTTFTASQGLMLMLPNMFKIAGELTSTVFHVAARQVSTHALTIFAEHSDVMTARTTGFALLPSNSIQEVMDNALIAQAATLEARVPFVHFFDGFRSSHEIQKIELIPNEVMQEMIDPELVKAHRERAMSPDNPVLRGTAQNPDHYFQARETVNPYYMKTPEIVQKYMDKFAGLTGRQYKLFDYVGDPEADRVITLMGSGSEAVQETVEYLADQGESVGLLKVRLYRPFSGDHFNKAMPKSAKVIAALDRTKEPGAGGEPLYLDTVNAIAESVMSGNGWAGSMPKVVGGRYGLSSKEFNPAMIKGVFDEMKKDVPKNHFTVGIYDDVTNTSLDWDEDFSTESEQVHRSMFYGLGSDGTVSANKNSIKIIGETTDNYVQGYFVYDSKKAGAQTVSHLRFSPEPIRSTYLIKQANFVGCHQWTFLNQYDILKSAQKGATFLLNSQYGPEEVWDELPKKVQEQIIEKELDFYVIDAYRIAKEIGLGTRINTIMQTCFFALSEILPEDEAIQKIKDFIKKTYGKKGEKIVSMNFNAVDKAVENMHQVDVPSEVTSVKEMPPTVSPEAPEFVREVEAKILAKEGDSIPVSAFPAGGTFPTGTTKWEKRNIALEIPVWDEEVCIQCNKCAIVCPHATIRPKVFPESALENAPETFKSVDVRGRSYPDDYKYALQVAPEDCTGCGLCVEVCPAKNKEQTGLKAINMEPQPPIREQEAENWDFFLELPEYDRSKLKIQTVKESQYLEPLFEFSGACAGCGETPYVKLASQLFGDRMIVANATGCSSIFGGNLPTTPWAKNKDGRGPTWSNSLFEDNAEFGFGFRIALDKQQEFGAELLKKMEPELGSDLVSDILEADQRDEEGLSEQRKRIEQLKAKLDEMDETIDVRNLKEVADTLARKSVWIMGGDGWAYDIGYGGLDHVLASGRDVNVMVLDTEVYSNTGGQMSKATPRGAVAKFAAAGKPAAKKDLGKMAMSYGNVYVAKIAMGAKDAQTVKALLEAEAYEGPSLIIAYSPCIEHGYDLAKGAEQQELAVESGYWPLFRFDPRLKEQGKNPLQMDSKAPKIPLKDYAYNETRYKILKKVDPERAERLMEEAQEDVKKQWESYEQMASYDYSNGSGE
ncbi:MAG: pyruvate:ferredoxin (flavodoxin) oxidoreductase [Candidatus Marinimicrobia bacterium]|nr:pyruvate:ferredoxin (flavodoxin) oxidoreductase [Candidatus Neomarinimicrobiota bacterium]MCF7829256.1 pyruvate:ferredoxin (flavodoxin) oxidoreductase [Candidatus Neomarinimicrobiota bacterium]MCF7881091.1 pyruvate:ferredoxin (flavodoxin) oxidoreductase [Candidatus Neomarinimicrobiota bacterium]